MEYEQHIARFSLAPLAVPYENWNGKTELFCDGKPTKFLVLGCDLKAQCQSGKYYLLVTEYDCVFEESVTVTLLADNFRPIASSTIPQILYPVIGAPSWFFEKLVWLDTHHFDLYIKDEPHFYRYTIHDFAIPLIRPRLSKRLTLRQA